MTGKNHLQPLHRLLQCLSCARLQPITFAAMTHALYLLFLSIPGRLTQPGCRWLALVAAAFTAQPFDIATAATMQDKAATVEEIVVVGSRRAGRMSSESYSPVDVVTERDLRNQGNTDVLDLLRTVSPTFSVNMQPIADGATIVRPPNLRNLAADHTLVLVNGKRRHRGAVIAWLTPKASEGAQGPDLSVIPAIALQRIEVLRDGAAAQYGSDAIAGVMNFVLKDNPEGMDLEARYGETSAGDGARYTVAANAGLPLGAGFLNLSLEYGEAGDTSRSVQRDDAAALIAAGNTAVADPAQIWGSPEIEDEIKTFFNAGLPLTERLEAFVFGNFARKETDGGFYFRNPNNREGVYTRGGRRLVGDLTGAGNCPRDLLPEGRFYRDGVFDTRAFKLAHPDCFIMNELFPGGFTPRFGGRTRDYSLVAGLRGETESGLAAELSAGIGVSDVAFFIRNTVNAALGPGNPADFAFDPGAYVQQEKSVNLDLTYPVDMPFLASDLNVAFGLEWREEKFEIEGGEPASWERTFERNGVVVDLQSQGFTAATNGFPGFSPDTAGAWSRSHYAVYLDLEADVLDNWTLGAALRHEDYQDFGATTNGKLSTRLALTDALSLRGSWSTGFRAPTPGQSNAINATSKNAGDGRERALSIVATIAPASPVGIALGGVALRPEKSGNVSAGLVYDQDATILSFDCFRIKVKDRLALSRDIELNRPDLGADRVRADLIGQLEAAGLTSARSWNYINYFTNDFNTVTKGCEFTGSQTLETAAGITDLELALSTIDTKITDFTAGGPLDNAGEIRDYEQGLPNTRYILTARHAYGPFDLMLRYSRHGGWYDSEEGLEFGGYGLVDISADYTMDNGLTLTLGSDNLLGNYPDRNPNARSGLGNLYSQYAPAGFNGRFLYVRLGVAF